MSRIEKFRKSFDTFMSSSFQLPNWTLVKETETHAGKEHRFKLTIPDVFFEEIPHFMDSGNMEFHQARKVQVIPGFNTFEDKFKVYFRTDHTFFSNEVTIGNQSLDTRSALLTRTENIIENEEVTQLITEQTIEIILRLRNRCGLPFPDPSNSEIRLKQLEDENMRLRDKVSVYRNESYGMQNYYRDRLERERSKIVRIRKANKEENQKLINKNQRDISRILGKLQEYYKNDPMESCPVCLESIQPSQLYITSCCHYLCKPCANQIEQLNKKCPICRDQMYTASDDNPPPSGTVGGLSQEIVGVGLDFENGTNNSSGDHLQIQGSVVHRNGVPVAELTAIV